MTKAERLELQQQKLIEMSARENELHAQGMSCIAGIDEVGRGPLAGPVYAAVVVLPEGFDVLGINDSKKLSAKKREELSTIIKERALAYGIGIADNHEIDELNILNATKAAMLRAIDACNESLKEKAERRTQQALNDKAEHRAQQTDSPEELRGEAVADHIEHLLIDAVKLDVDIPQESIIKGDEKCLCIAAASILAKVARDSFMVEMDEQYPGYDFAGNKGYGTAAHYTGLRELGYTPIHRRSFLKKFEEEQAGERAAAWGSVKQELAAWSNVQQDASDWEDKPVLQKSASNDGMEKDVSNNRMETGMAKKVYAVRKGRETGLFMDWDSCKKLVDGFPGAEYKSFADPQEALAYLGLAAGAQTDKTNAPAMADKDGAPGIRAYVDGSYNVASRKFSCGVVIVRTAENGAVTTEELNACFDDETAAEQRNVAGEIMGARLAIEYCIANGIKDIEILHDYEGVGKWADNLWKANNPLTQGYKAFVAEARQSMRISFTKVKAHAGNKYNELADKLAKEALK